jgi:hypothetical protein
MKKVLGHPLVQAVTAALFAALTVYLLHGKWPDMPWLTRLAGVLQLVYFGLVIAYALWRHFNALSDARAARRKVD